MTQQDTRPAAAQTIIILAALSVWCASAIVAGVMNRSHDWAVACLVAGGLAATALIVGIVVKSWLVSLYGVLAITGAGDGSNRLFLATQHGTIHVWENNPQVRRAPLFLDIRDRVAFDESENESSKHDSAPWN